MAILLLLILTLGFIVLIVKLWNHPAVMNKNPEEISWSSDIFGDSDTGSAASGDADGGCDGGDGGCD